MIDKAPIFQELRGKPSKYLREVERQSKAALIKLAEESGESKNRMQVMAQLRTRLEVVQTLLGVRSESSDRLNIRPEPLASKPQVARPLKPEELRLLGDDAASVAMRIDE